MPIVNIKTNQLIAEEDKKAFYKQVATSVSDIMSKPKSDVQILHSVFDIWMNNSDAPAAFINIRFVSGLTDEIAAALCTKLGSLLQSVINIDLARVNINFIDVQTVHAWKFLNQVAVCPPQAN